MKNKLYVLFLTIAMTITMLPLSVFAEEPAEAGSGAIYGSETPADTTATEESDEPDGSKENPYVMAYYHNNYNYDAWTAEDFDKKEMWFKLEVRSETTLGFQASVYGDEDTLRSATIYDSDMKTVVYKFDYNDEYDYYDTELLNLKKQTYYFKLKFYAAPSDRSVCIYSRTEESPAATGTFEDPIVFKADKNISDDEYEDYYTDDYFYLEADTQSVYYRLDAFKTAYYSLSLATYNEVGIKSIKLLDADRNELDVFERLDSEPSTDPTDYANYGIVNYKLEKDKTYYIEVLIDNPVEYDALEMSVYRLAGNGQEDYPFVINNQTSEYSLWYYGFGTVYKNHGDIWFKATIEEDIRVKAYFGIMQDENPVEEVTMYVNDDETGTKLAKNEYDVYSADEYCSLKKGDVVRIKVALNDKAVVGTDMFCQLDGFGLTDEEVTLELDRDEYTWNGKEKTPALAYVKYKDKDLTPGTDYETEVTYINNVDIGYGEVEVTGKGEYLGKRYLFFAINPKGTKMTSVSAGTKSLTANWKMQDKKMSVKRISGYEIQYSTSKNFTDATTKSVKVKGYKKTSKTIKKLKSGKKYYVRVRTYYVDDWDAVYSAWSAAKTVRVK